MNSDGLPWNHGKLLWRRCDVAIVNLQGVDISHRTQMRFPGKRSEAAAL